jgi:hypothetical protein
MDIYTPPIVAVIGGLALVGLCFALRIPIFIVGLLSLVLLCITIVLNRNMFEIEYDNMTFGKAIGGLLNTVPTNGLASMMIIATVTILALGYIINLFGLSSLYTNATMRLSSIVPTSFMASTPQAQYRDIDYSNTSARRNYASNFNRAI